MKCLLMVALLVVPILSTRAQEMGPPKEVKNLGWSVGTWTGNGKIAFGGQETPISSATTISYGMFLKVVSSDKSTGFTMTKTAMIGWDAKKNEYISDTFTNMSPIARIAHGKVDGNKLIMVSNPLEAEGMSMVARETMLKVPATKVGSMMEYKMGEKWMTGMDFVLTKSK